MGFSPGAHASIIVSLTFKGTAGAQASQKGGGVKSAPPYAENRLNTPFEITFL